MDAIEYAPIGVVRSPHAAPQGMPIQPAGARGTRGQVIVAPEYADGLADLDGFSHIILLYHFHRSEGFSLTVRPFLDPEPRGLFATRAPRRPNPIGLSVVRLLSVQDDVLEIEDVDILDGTPLLDIKPYVPGFDHPGETRIGWLEGRSGDAQETRADDRFA